MAYKINRHYANIKGTKPTVLYLCVEITTSKAQMHLLPPFSGEPAISECVAVETVINLPHPKKYVQFFSHLSPAEPKSWPGQPQLGKMSL